jgi:hypothetical protein
MFCPTLAGHSTSRLHRMSALAPRQRAYDKLQSAPGAQTARQPPARTHRGEHAGSRLQERNAGPPRARWTGDHTARNSTRRHAADHRCLGGDHRSRSRGARRSMIMVAGSALLPIRRTSPSAIAHSVHNMNGSPGMRRGSSEAIPSPSRKTRRQGLGRRSGPERRWAKDRRLGSPGGGISSTRRRASGRRLRACCRGLGVRPAATRYGRVAQHQTGRSVSSLVPAQQDRGRWPRGAGVVVIPLGCAAPHNFIDFLST